MSGHMLTERFTRSLAQACRCSFINGAALSVGHFLAGIFRRLAIPARLALLDQQVQLELLAPLVLPAQPDPPALMVLPVPLDPRELLVLLVLLALLDQQALLDQPARLERIRPLLVRLAPRVQMAHLVQQALLDPNQPPLAPPGRQGRKEILEPLAQQVQLDLLVAAAGSAQARPSLWQSFLEVKSWQHQT